MLAAALLVVGLWRASTIGRGSPRLLKVEAVPKRRRAIAVASRSLISSCSAASSLADDALNSNCWLIAICSLIRDVCLTGGREEMTRLMLSTPPSSCLGAGFESLFFPKLLLIVEVEDVAGGLSFLAATIAGVGVLKATVPVLCGEPETSFSIAGGSEGLSFLSLMKRTNSGAPLRKRGWWYTAVFLGSPSGLVGNLRKPHLGRYEGRYGC